MSGSKYIVLHAADLSLDLVSRRVERAGQLLRLNERETDLLAYLMWRRNRVVPLQELREQLWGLSFDPETNSIAVHICRLRKAMDRRFDRKLIHSAKGGYVLAEHDPFQPSSRKG